VSPLRGRRSRREDGRAVGQSRTREFDGSSASGRAARVFVSDTLDGWGQPAYTDNALLCVAELAANAVLHGRGPFRVAVSQLEDGVRVEVLDARGDDVPIAVPPSGVAAAVIADSTTGRGLQLVAAVATRWGVVTRAGEKSVWAEIGEAPPEAPTDPILDLHEAAERPATRTPIRLLSLPVRLAVASGMQVDELVREIQLGLFEKSVTAAERSRFYDLLDRSAPARLAGRRAALDASASGDERFDLELAVDNELFEAVVAFRDLIEALPNRQPATAAAASSDVMEFRAWLEAEVISQVAGNPGTPCPLK
jgi:hypothetical protein